MWYLIVLIPDLCTLTYFDTKVLRLHRFGSRIFENNLFFDDFDSFPHLIEHAISIYCNVKLQLYVKGFA